MSTLICTFDDCGPAKKLTRGLCPKHYQRLLRHGDPGATSRVVVTGSDADRFWARIDQSGNCWLWQGSLSVGGYGRFRLNGQDDYVHRVAYAWLVGPIPEGYEVDHVWARGCRRRNCVRPDHLEAVTGEENRRRATAVHAKTHCPWGHPRDGMRRGGRYCLTCNRERTRAWYQARPGRGAASARAYRARKRAAVKLLPDPRRL